MQKIYCPKCGDEMYWYDEVEDYYDPRDYMGHGQLVVDRYLVCNSCDYTEDE